MSEHEMSDYCNNPPDPDRPLKLSQHMRWPASSMSHKPTQPRDVTREQDTTAQLAHELNNLLDGSMRRLRLAMRRVSDDPEQAENPAMLGHLHQVDSSLKQMADLVRRAMYEGPRHAQQMFHQTATLSEAVAAALAMIRMQFEHMALSLNSEVSEQAATQPAGPIYTVLANLMRNAAQAMDGAGSIEVTARFVSGYIELNIDDDGPGFAPHVKRNKQGLPAKGLTTRPQGHGLGLSLCRDIMDALGGSLRLIDLPDGGIRARLRWPAEPSHPNPTRNAG